MARGTPWTFDGRRPRFRFPRPRMRSIVLCGTPELPLVLDIANPDRHRGAVAGIPVAVGGRAACLSELERPIACGRYAFSDGQGTLVSAAVGPGRCQTDDGCGPGDSVAEQAPAPEPAQVVFLALRKPRDDVLESVRFQTALAERLAILTHGSVFDMDGCRRYDPAVPPASALASLDVFRHVTCHVEQASSGALWCHSHGLVKFGRPELELFDVPADMKLQASALLFCLAQSLLDGATIRPGDRMGPDRGPLLVRTGRNPEGHFDVPVLELAPPREGGSSALRELASALQRQFETRHGLTEASDLGQIL